MTNGNIAIWKGNPYPLGATWDGEGVNFALFSEQAEKVEVCLFDTRGRREIARAQVKWRTDQVWHCYLPEARPGLLYGYRVHGPYDPKKGMRFNANKLVLDPYAKDIAGTVKWSDALFGYRVGSPREDLVMDRRDSAPGMPKARVIDGAFSWGDDRAPRTPWRETIIYELHVKGFTINHPDVPPEMRGTYAGLASAPAIEHLKRLGVTAIELMPVHTFVDDRGLIQRGLKNYWGYNSIGYFAPDSRYSHSGYVHEFKTLVKRMHTAGIEVILDVVYNHTAEGNHMGPTLSFRGIDNAAYYRLGAGDPRFYMDFTGCGNTLNMLHPRVLQLIMDSLRYWVLEMHVDGFRFDLASALARELYEVDRLGAFFDIIHQDPVLSQVKLIAEPWDLGEGGYQVGNFPVGWAEWNGRYRDAIRSYWRGDGGLLGELGYRLTGSSDLYEQSGRRPYASINFMTCHDGFTLRDLVSYDHKHNEANGEENRDGTDDNRSWNCGAEGATNDPEIRNLRVRQMRNFLTTLFLSQGVPMLLAGDEICRTQNGNNNAYCQDNPIGWIDWNSTPDDQAMVEFVSALVAMRKRHAAFRRATFFHGRPIRGTTVKDIVWLAPRGTEMTERDWNDPNSHALGMFLSGEAIEDDDERGRPIADDNFLLLLNNSDKTVIFRPAGFLPRRPWTVLLDTARVRAGIGEQRRLRITDNFPVQPRSAALMTQPREAAAPTAGPARTGAPGTAAGNRIGPGLSAETTNR
jgi:isoamylase